MSADSKISPAFEPFLADSGPNDKREAIVIYRAPAVEEPRVRGRLRALKQRLDFVKARAASQRPVEAALVESYRKAGAKRVTRKDRLGAVSIGTSALPVAAFEVTRKTLPALAEQPNVVAVLPNQRVELIRPKEVDYAQLAKQECKDGLTWGLKRLDIPKLWATTKGRDVNVGVLDTGVGGSQSSLRIRRATIWQTTKTL